MHLQKKLCQHLGHIDSVFLFYVCRSSLPLPSISQIFTRNTRLRTFTSSTAGSECKDWEDKRTYFLSCWNALTFQWSARISPWLLIVCVIPVLQWRVSDEKASVLSVVLRGRDRSWGCENLVSLERLLLKQQSRSGWKDIKFPLSECLNKHLCSCGSVQGV